MKILMCERTFGGIGGPSGSHWRYTDEKYEKLFNEVDVVIKRGSREKSVTGFIKPKIIEWLKENGIKYKIIYENCHWETYTVKYSSIYDKFPKRIKEIKKEMVGIDFADDTQFMAFSLVWL